MARTGTEYNIPHALNATVALWWVALVASVLTSFVVPYVMFTHHNHANDTLTAAWMLPIVPPITVAAAGATFAKLLIVADRLEYALTVLLASYVMCGVGTLIALGLMVIYFQRLAVFHLPPREVIVSTFCEYRFLSCGIARLLTVIMVYVCSACWAVRAGRLRPDRAGPGGDHPVPGADREVPRAGRVSGPARRRSGHVRVGRACWPVALGVSSTLHCGRVALVARWRLTAA